MHINAEGAEYLIYAGCGLLFLYVAARLVSLAYFKSRDEWINGRKFPATKGKQ